MCSSGVPQKSARSMELAPFCLAKYIITIAKVAMALKLGYWVSFLFHREGLAC